MNLIFTDKLDIDYNEKKLLYLKEKSDVAANFYSIIRLYNYISQYKNYELIFTASQIKKDFEGVNRNLSGSGGFQYYSLQTDEFVSSLANYEKIAKSMDRFSYSFKSNKVNALNFIKKCARPECMTEFINKYSKEISKFIHLDAGAEKNEYIIYDQINNDYISKLYEQNVKKIYFMLNSFKNIVDKDFEYSKLAIVFERGFLINENQIKSIVFIGEKTKKFNWSYPITFKMSNMLAKDGKEVDVGNIHNLNHILYIENTAEGWLKFDKDILEDYYDDFSKICLHNQLNNNLNGKKTNKLFKI